MHRDACFRPLEVAEGHRSLVILTIIPTTDIRRPEFPACNGLGMASIASAHPAPPTVSMVLRSRRREEIIPSGSLLSGPRVSVRSRMRNAIIHYFPNGQTVKILFPSAQRCGEALTGQRGRLHARGLFPSAQRCRNALTATYAATHDAT